jgi:hypothetical protein
LGRQTRAFSESGLPNFLEQIWFYTLCPSPPHPKGSAKTEQTENRLAAFAATSGDGTVITEECSQQHHGGRSDCSGINAASLSARNRKGEIVDSVTIFIFDCSLTPSGRRFRYGSTVVYKKKNKICLC